MVLTWLKINLNWINFKKKKKKKNSDEEMEKYFSKVNVLYVENLVNLHDKEAYTIHIRNLKQELNHGLLFKKLHRVIKLNQNAWKKIIY